MKLFFGMLLTLLIIALAWLSMGWIAFIVLPFGGLVALLSFSELILEWEQEQATQTHATKNRKTETVAARPAQARC